MSQSAARFPRCLGGFDGARTPVLRTDVLVIGAGVAGSTAALAAAELGVSVLLLSKVPVSDSNTAWAQGGMAAVLGEHDSVDLHVADTLRVGAGLTDRDVARRVISEGSDVIDDLIRIGAKFDAESTGRLELSREGGHSVSRVVHAHGDSTGAEIQRALASQVAKHPRIVFKVGAFTRDLVVSEGRCVGAITQIDGIDMAVEAPAVLLASGGAGQVYRETTNPMGACGDGVAAAFRAGAELAGMEFYQFHPTTLYIAGASRFLISEVVRGAGATLRDRHGERFMSSVHPDAELAPRDVVSRAILDRMVATGDTHVYLDLSTVRGDPRQLFPTISRICASFDIDVTRDPIPVRPGAHYMIGGVATDRDGRSSVPGLYAAGETASSGLHGANRLASNSLLEGAVLGRSAGRASAQFAISNPSADLPKFVAGPRRMENPPRLHLDDMLYSLKSLMWRDVGLKRTEQGLADALHRVLLWHRYVMHAGVTTRQAFEIANMLTVSVLVTSSALTRNESRGTHFRSDRPKRDDEAWSRSVFMSRDDDGGIHTRLGPLHAPTDRDSI